MFLTYYLLMGLMISSAFMQIPHLDMLMSEDERKALFVTAFLMWPLVLIVMIFER